MSFITTPADPGPLAAALKRGNLFERWTDPESGVESYLLSRRVAPIQQTFYFVNSGFSDDGRFLWIYGAFPPGGDSYYGRQLAVVDFAERHVRHFPETQFMDASPFVDGPTGDVFWTTGLGVWKRGAAPDAAVERVGQFPAELARDRRPLRLATHLTRSADGAAFALDAQVGNEWFVGDIAADGTRGFRLWQQFEICHNHAQFSPTDPDVMLLAQDGWFDVVTGEEGQTRDRLWLLRRGERASPILPHAPLPASLRGHEWWDADGVHVWCVDYHEGTTKINTRTGHRALLWPNGHTHSHCDRAGKLLVGDIHDHGDRWRITFFNVATGKEIDVVTRLPALTSPRRSYHVHPHPRFCLGDRYICYTTNVLGRVDVAIVPVEPLIARTS